MSANRASRGLADPRRGGNGSGRRRWRPDPSIKWHFDIDVVGSCNLRCPSCPVGNSWDARTPTAYMRPELLRKIMDKATSECGRLDVALYNWTEPFLHPKLAEMIRVVRSYGVSCGLSTNLNLINNLDAIMQADPGMLKISLSGFTQDTYRVTHRRGDIEVVKRNMAAVAEARSRARSATRIEVIFHRYLGNHGDEARMGEYAESLGFEFTPVWAYLMPLEKALAFAAGGADDARLSDGDRALIDRLALPLDRAIEAAKRARAPTCSLRDRQMTLTPKGDVMLCCTVYDQSKYTLGAYLDIPLDELQEMKYRHRQCGTCMKHGLHTLFTYASEEFDRLALDNVARRHPDARLEGMGARERRGIRGLPRRAKREYDKLRARLGIGA